MKIKRLPPLLLIIIVSCHSPADKPAQVQPATADTTRAAPNPPAPATSAILKTHLRDTTYAAGSVILFLRPDSARYDELNNDPEGGAGDGDSDFGVRINNTMDSLSKNERYKAV